MILENHTGVRVCLGFLHVASPPIESSGWFIDEVTVEIVPVSSWNVEGFELGWQRWHVTRGQWEIGPLQSGSGKPPSCYGASGSCAGTALRRSQYHATTDSRLVGPSVQLPVIDLAVEELQLRFWHWFSYAARDQGSVQVSTFDEETGEWGVWRTVEETASESITDVSGVWSPFTVDLSAYAGRLVRLGFLHGADRESPFSSSEDTGWFLDDLSIVITPVFGWNAQDFEGGWEDWHATRGQWEIDTLLLGASSKPPTCHGGNRCAGTALRRSQYDATTDSRLVSPSVELPDIDPGEQIQLRLWQWFSYAAHDSGVLELSVYDQDEGAWDPWEPVAESVGEASSVWSRFAVDLSAYAGRRVRLGFFHMAEVGSGFSNESSGWFVDDLTIEVLTPRFTGDFERGWEDWSSTRGQWEIGRASSSSGPGGCYRGGGCAGTILAGSYHETTDSRLVSAPVDLRVLEPGDELRLHFWHWFSYGPGDSGVVQLSVFDRASERWSAWSSVSSSVTSGVDDDEWKLSTAVNLSEYAGERVRIGFYHRADTPVSFHTGWSIDDVCIALNGMCDVTPRCLTADDCNDREICTDDLCIGEGTCDYRSNARGCNDGEYCNGEDTCRGGTCSAHGLPPCPGPDGDGNCAESCDEATNSCFAPDPNGSPCNDGVFCNGADTCSGGFCVHAGNPCAGRPECTDRCDEAADNCHDPAGTRCADDGNVCTDDQCDGAGACAHPANAAPCNDGLFCNGTDACADGQCKVHRGDSCAGGFECANVCNETTDNCFVSRGATCTDDGKVCTDDVCDGFGNCTHPAKLGQMPCDDGLFCNGTDVCANGVCVHSGSPCQESCIDICEESTDSCVEAEGKPCEDDSNPCTEDVCIDGSCTHSFRTGCCIVNGDCDDGNACTDDFCDGLRACAHIENNQPCDDGLFCNGTDVCGNGVCVHSGSPCLENCVDTCEESTDSCVEAEGKPCEDDSNPCTEDVCIDGDCTHSFVTGCCTADDDCDDGDVCTEDFCDAFRMCAHFPEFGSCEDGDPCTANEACVFGEGCVGELVDVVFVGGQVQLLKARPCGAEQLPRRAQKCVQAKAKRVLRFLRRAVTSETPSAKQKFVGRATKQLETVRTKCLASSRGGGRISDRCRGTIAVLVAKHKGWLSECGL